MKKRKCRQVEYKKVCAECGQMFVSHGACAKYCEKCKEAAYKRMANRYAIRANHDTEEMRNACLTCTKSRCSGSCEKLARIYKGETV